MVCFCICVCICVGCCCFAGCSFATLLAVLDPGAWSLAYLVHPTARLLFAIREFGFD